MKKKELDALKKDLTFKKESLSAVSGGKAVTDYCEGYKKFIDNSKTEREAVKYTLQLWGYPYRRR